MINLKNYIETHKERFLEELISLLKIPSISADSAYKNDVIRTAEVIKTSLEDAGCDTVEICETLVHNERQNNQQAKGGCKPCLHGW